MEKEIQKGDRVILKQQVDSWMKDRLFVVLKNDDGLLSLGNPGTTSDMPIVRMESIYFKVVGQ